MEMEALFYLFEGLERKGPGSNAATLAALALCSPLPPRPAVVDLGCGAGASTLVLAREWGVPITAVDVHAGYLEELRGRAEAQGLGGLITTLEADFAHLPFAPASFDLIWSEGAIFILGWEEGLKAWEPLLRPGGLLAVTEMAWLVDDPPAEAKDYFAVQYPALTTVAENWRVAEALGFEMVGGFALPAEDWTDYFYAPLEVRCRDLRGALASGAALPEGLAETLDEMDAEIDMYRRFGSTYGYVFFVLRRPA